MHMFTTQWHFDTVDTPQGWWGVGDDGKLIGRRWKVVQPLPTGEHWFRRWAVSPMDLE